MQRLGHDVMRCSGCRLWIGLIISLGLTVLSPLSAGVPREGPAVGSIVLVRGDEQLQWVNTSDWQVAVLEQALLGGDTLRTGPFGGLGLLFADQTQIRVQRNSLLTVRAVGAAQPSRLRLEQGGVWSRAATQGQGVVLDTPSATAAIRGTEWSLHVDDQGTTVLVVIEGEVELFNAFGRVQVQPGEMASARIGEAPVKTVLVRPEWRTQYILHLEFRDAMWWLTLTDGTQAERRRQRAQAMAAVDTLAASGAGDHWAQIARWSYDLGDYHQARLAAERLPATHAEADLIPGLLAALSGDLAQAESLLTQTAERLPADALRVRLAVDWVRYALRVQMRDFAAAESLGVALTTARTATLPLSRLAQAWVLGYQGELSAAVDLLARAREAYPHDARLAAMAAELAVLLGRTEAAEAAARAAVALDHEDAMAWSALGLYLTYLTPERSEAIAALTQATQLAPDWPQGWARLGEVLRRDDRPRQAERALRASLQHNPGENRARLSLALLLLQDLRVADAMQWLDETPVHTVQTAAAQGRLALLRGQTAAALTHYLEASTAEPLLSTAEIGLAASYYHQGDVARAQQALANADRLDAQDPTPPLMASVIAADRFAVDEAIVNAREALRRIRVQESGRVTALAASRDGAMTLGRSFRDLGLAQWGQFYDELAFSAFDPNSQVARFLRSPNSQTAYANIANTLDPINLYSRNRRTDFFYRPFTDLTTEGRYRSYAIEQPLLFGRERWDEQHLGAELRAYSAQSRPTSMVVVANQTQQTTGFSSLGEPGRRERVDGNMAVNLGGRLTARTSLFGQISYSHSSSSTHWSPIWLDEDQIYRLASLGFGHRLDDRDLLLAVVSYNTTDQLQRYEFGERSRPPEFDLRYHARLDVLAGTVRRITQYGDWTLGYGVDWARAAMDVDYRNRPTGADFGSYDQTTRAVAGDVDLSWRVNPQWMIQGGLLGSAWSDPNAKALGQDTRDWVARLGVAWTPDDQQMLRLALRKDPPRAAILSMTPPDTVGLFPSEARLNTRTQSVMARWDREWNPRLFTAFTAEHYTNERLDRLDQNGTLERYGIHLNVWLGQGVGLFAEHQRLFSEITSPGPRRGAKLPLVPDDYTRIGLRWVQPSSLTLSLQHQWVGPRVTELTSQPRLERLHTTDLTLSREFRERQGRVSLRIDNLLDRDYSTDQLDPEFGGHIPFNTVQHLNGQPFEGVLVPGAGRTFSLSGQWRF